jgi:hypothetical protein
VSAADKHEEKPGQSCAKVKSGIQVSRNRAASAGRYDGRKAELWRVSKLDEVSDVTLDEACEHARKIDALLVSDDTRRKLGKTENCITH